MNLPPSAARVVVSDSGPLIALARLDLLPLLNSLFSDVQIPEAVFAECIARPELVDAQRIQAAMNADQIHLCEATPVVAPGLDAGESFAIGRAVAIGAMLLADDRAARRHALALQLRVIGTLGVLVQAKRLGLIDAVAPQVEAMRAHDHWLSDTAVAEALRAADE